MSPVPKILRAIILIMTCCCADARGHIRLNNTALRKDSEIQIVCESPGFLDTVLIKHGITPGEYIPVTVSSTYNISRVLPRDAGYYLCDYSKSTVNSNLAQLVVIDSEVKCGELELINDTMIVATCEVIYYSTGPNPRLTWTGFYSENETVLQELFIDENYGKNLTRKISSNVTVFYPDWDGNSLTCQLYFEPINESMIQGNHQGVIVALNAPEYSDSCSTQKISWKSLNPQIDPTTEVFTEKMQTTSGTMKKNSSENSVTKLNNRNQEDSSTGKSSITGSSSDVKPAAHEGGGATTGMFIGVMAAAAAIIMSLIVAIAYVCVRSPNAAGCCGKHQRTVVDDPHLIYPPSYQPLVKSGAAYQELRGPGVEYNSYSYIDGDKFHSSKKSGDNGSLGQSPSLLNKLTKNEISGSSGKLSNSRALPNPPAWEMSLQMRTLKEKAHGFGDQSTLPSSPYEVYDVIEDATYQQIRNSKVDTTDSIHDDGYLVSDFTLPPIISTCEDSQIKN